MDVKGTFLKGRFDPNENLYMEVPKVFLQFYSGKILLKLNHTSYGVKNATKAFWLVLLTLLGKLSILHCKTDTCLYYKWTDQYGLSVILSWINDVIICGKMDGVLHCKN